MIKKAFGALKEEFGLKKVIAILILLASMGFLLTQNDGLKYSSNYFNNEHISQITHREYLPYKRNDEKMQKVKDDELRYKLNIGTTNLADMRGNSVCEQTFQAQEKQVKSANLVFISSAGAQTSGEVLVEIIDKNGKTLCSSVMPAGSVKHNTPTLFDFVEDNSKVNKAKLLQGKFHMEKLKGRPINKGEEYTLRVSAKNVKSPGTFGICLTGEKYNDDFKLTVNGEDQGQTRLFATIAYIHLPKLIVAIFVLGYLLGLLLVLLPLKHISEALSRRWKREIDLNKWILRCMYVVMPFMLYWMNGKAMGSRLVSILQLLRSVYGLWNIAVLIGLWLLVYLICNRTKYSVIILTVIGFIFATANYLLVMFRNQPLSAADFLSIGTAMDVAASYSLVFTKQFLWIVVFATLFIAVPIGLTSYKGLSLKKRGVLLLVTAVLCGSGYYTLYETNYLQTNGLFVSGFDPSRSYKYKGAAFCFVMTTTQIKVEKPEGYSAEEAAKIMAEYPSDPAPKTTVPTKQQPNVIAIMNESFSDLGINGELKTSGPYMPYFYSLKENAVHGIMHASVFGGGTANSEFEFLTGNSMGFIPFRTVPYTIYIREDAPSLATTMKDSGYCGNIAFHPGHVTSYNRDNVYPKLGFDEFISLDKLQNPKRIRAFVSDAYDFDVIKQQYEQQRASGKKDPFFLFNVTIQNHGQYMTANGMVPRSIDVEDSAIKSDEQTEQFINLMKLSDDAFKDLVEYFKKVKEPTVILMFGDHQPNVGDLFFDTMKDRMDPNMDPVEKSETRYKVPFIIWANYDIQEKDDVEISANYLRPYLLQTVGASMTGHDKFLMDTYKQIPVRTANCFRGANGVLYPYSASSPYDEAMRKYQIVQYNNLVDQKNRVNDFFYLKKGQKGNN